MTKLTAAEVAALDPYKFMAVIGKTVIHSGGRCVHAGAARPAQARQVFLGQVCPGVVFATIDDWVEIYSSAGLTSVEARPGRSR